MMMRKVCCIKNSLIFPTLIQAEEPAFVEFGSAKGRCQYKGNHALSPLASWCQLRALQSIEPFDKGINCLSLNAEFALLLCKLLCLIL